MVFLDNKAPLIQVDRLNSISEHATKSSIKPAIQGYDSVMSAGYQPTQ